MANRYEEHKPVDDYHYDDNDEEKIYEAIVYDTTPRKSLKKESKDKRDYPIDELLDTEQRYLNLNLKMIKKHFMSPLKSIMHPEEFEKIFFKIDELILLHESLYAQLSDARNNDTSIGEPFTKNKMKFTVYGNYCSNLPMAEEMLQDVIKRSDLFRNQIIKCQHEMGLETKSQFPLNEILKVPMQRSLKYSLLLETIFKNSNATHTDKDSIQTGLNAMKDLGNYINEMKRDTEMLLNIKHIENSIAFFDMPRDTELKDYGRLLMDGEMKVSLVCLKMFNN